MKNPLFITVILLLFFTSFLKAQDYYIGKPLEFIMQDMKLNDYKFGGVGKTLDGQQKFVSYYLNTQKLTFYFNMDDNDCLRIIEFEPRKTLLKTIKKLDLHFFKINNTTWKTLDGFVFIKLDIKRVPEVAIITYSAVLM